MSKYLMIISPVIINRRTGSRYKLTPVAYTIDSAQVGQLDVGRNVNTQPADLHGAGGTEVHFELDLASGEDADQPHRLDAERST